jgi:phosphoribosylformimino-5-aminoimidazole carboxamide ribotide isomerase
MIDQRDGTGGLSRRGVLAGGSALALSAAVAPARAQAGLDMEAAARIVPVFASESLPSREALRRCFERHPAGVLSLDRRDGRRLDPAGCWDAPELWPARLIVMTLERVGADAGPDLDTLREVQARAPAVRLIGAGGVRNPADLARAAEAGAEAWLVASALHDGRLPRA